MRILIDTNVLLDIVLRREPFFKASQAVVAACQQEFFDGAISAQTIADMFYILRKVFDKTARQKTLSGFCKIFHVASVDERKIISALENEDFHDFEDCLQAECAKDFLAAYIITRNGKHFAHSPIPAITPEEFCSRYLEKENGA